ncbi:MAG: ImmA/IrrE family metallo-endopeptidase [Bacillota bacterium]|nr:ImmA/IrrE family metallo-endopeptidase [Bacillota bacterium]
MANKWIYDKVQDLVAKYQTRDPEDLAQRLNIKIKYIADTKSLLGMYKVLLKNRYIFIPSNLGYLKNTVLAHELGHDQLHRNYCKDGASFHESKLFNPSNQYEIEANIFAAHLLIRDEDVFAYLKEGLTDRDLALKLGVDINLLNLKISELVKLKFLPLESLRVQRPSSQFLKTYKPAEKSW